jgi:hypothetical protein
VLRSVPGAREALLEALSGCERLVLLGDVLELRHGPMQRALAAAGPVLRDVGAVLGSGREVLVVPGNHDHHLLTPWLERRGFDSGRGTLGLESAVDWREGEPLAAVAESLAPAGVRAAYPGAWLREDVYATHGHYSDRHTTVPMFERLGAGVMARVVREAPGGPRRAEDYEAILAPIYAWVHAVAQSGGPKLGESSHGASARAWRALAGSGGRRGLRRRGLVAAFPVAVAAMNRAGLGPVRADISSPELRRAALRAVGEVLSRLGVRAEHVIFGHTHRAGPLPGDDPAEWVAPAGARLLNTGSWVLERGFLGGRPADSPYRPGFAALLDEECPPELVNLLDRAAPE